MGDRVVIIVKDGDDVAPAIYGHWIGHEAPQALVAAGEAGLIRKGDASYAAARICGFLHSQDANSKTGLGLLDKPASMEPEALEDFSHGDAGIIVLDVGDGSLTYLHGYHARAEEGDVPTSVKLAA